MNNLRKWKPEYMNNVKRVNFRQEENPLERMPRYFCMNCNDGDVFKVDFEGQLHCASCRARIRDLRVVKK